MHDFYNLDDLLHMLASSNEALKHKHLIIIEHVSIKSSHYLKEMHRLKILADTEKLIILFKSFSTFDEDFIQYKQSCAYIHKFTG